MRLIKCDDLSIVERTGGPNELKESGDKYMILSHRWGDENDEVTFADIETPEGLVKATENPGIKKIEGICKMGSGNGFKYAWVDTCCIDKRNSQELSESINSMYYWYKSADCCVTYLNELDPGNGILTEDQLHNCSLFERGWTLQELIAPRIILFVDKQWNMRDHKERLAPVLSRITRINTKVLNGTRLPEQVAVAQIMSWAAGRRTKRVEDIAYCLLGIFGINMPLLYGERERAFKRLQEEILKKTGDLSIFAWTDPAHSANADLKATSSFASSPDLFRGCERVERLKDMILPHPSISITSAGVRFSTSIASTPGEELLLHLQCKEDFYPARLGKYRIINIPLYSTDHLHGYGRKGGNTRKIEPLDLDFRGSGLTDICLAQRDAISVSSEKLLAVTLQSQVEIPLTMAYYPEHLWNLERKAFVLHQPPSETFFGVVEIKMNSATLASNLGIEALTGIKASTPELKCWVFCALPPFELAAKQGRPECDTPLVAVLREEKDGTLSGLPGNLRNIRIESGKLQNPFYQSRISLHLTASLRHDWSRLPTTCAVVCGGRTIKFGVTQKPRGRGGMIGISARWSWGWGYRTLEVGWSFNLKSDYMAAGEYRVVMPG